MLKTCSLFITCHYQIYIPMPTELNPHGMFQDFAASEARLDFCIMTVTETIMKDSGISWPCFFPGPQVNVWIYGHTNAIFQNLNSSNFSLIDASAQSSTHALAPWRKKGIMLSSRTDFLFSLPPPPQPLDSTFLPHFLSAHKVLSP